MIEQQRNEEDDVLTKTLVITECKKINAIDVLNSLKYDVHIKHFRLHKLD